MIGLPLHTFELPGTCERGRNNGTRCLPEHPESPDQRHSVLRRVRPSPSGSRREGKTRIGRLLPQ